MKIVLIIISWFGAIPLTTVEIPQDSIAACERLKHRIEVTWFDADPSDDFGYVIECKSRDD